LVETLKRLIAEPPEWDALDTDQVGQFNKWKSWSSKMKLLRDIEAIWSMQSVEEEAKRQIAKEIRTAEG
jgi:hypothetical protein